ncbi:MAG TPA: ATP-binding protein [Chryseolinea sp.]|nr:ATP-binding protein [Chryseolinea sp.]
MKEAKTQELLERIWNLEEKLKEVTEALRQKNRELEIEFVLEKVRATITGPSATLAEASASLYRLINEMGIVTDRISIGIFDDPGEAIELWITAGAGDEGITQMLDYFSLHVHAVFENIFSARKQSKPDTVIVLTGNQLRDYYRIVSTHLPQQGNHEKKIPPEEFFNTFLFSHGAINVNTTGPLSQEALSILTKLTSAFGSAYPHFLGVQKAEAQTREIQRQQALDRVRAEIASMRTIRDLDKITPLIWKGLLDLNVEFTRCGVFIVNETEQVVHAYLSSASGNSLGVMKLPFDSLDTIKKIVQSWKEGEIYRDYWNRQQFESWVQAMVEMGQVTDIEKFLASDSTSESLSHKFTPFAQGMLYVGGHEYIDIDQQVDLVKSLADSFSVAYARYEDFIQIETANKKLEATLAELKATQSQLIQSEKMASLGELTTGIAHEIQNPLNFVNNFSEVSSELIDEMKAELATGNFIPATELAEDIKQNLAKITHHGKRADAIVKGMLQHSRTSSGVKEPTDINGLCEEYVRLAFHGLRAKDKAFHAKFETDLDTTIPKIAVVPQDIGRVVLNLINNAFYAVNEKAKSETQDDNGEKKYEPQVIVSTKNLGNRIEIRVKDNGNGIPVSIREKIFQPFFTTKPTGQGTGLGLSLSYDIVKAHGGDLKVVSTVKAGTVFIVELPASGN